MDKKTLREAQAHIGNALNFVQEVKDSEEETLDEKSDAYKESPAGEAMQEKITFLQDAIDALEQADASVEEAMKD